MTPQEDKPKKERHSKDEDNETRPDARKPQKDIRDKEKFSPGEPDDYNAEEFATD